MSDIIPFSYKEAQLRTVLIDGEPWFVLADLCKALDLSSPHKVYERVAEDLRGRSSIPTPGGTQEMAVVSEGGMYEVVIRSDKPEAATFRRWITGEVLPEIRKTGAYLSMSSLEGPELLAHAVLEAQPMLEAKDARIAKLEPPAAAWTELADAAGDYAVDEAAKVLCRAGIDTGQRRLFAFMGEIGWIYRHQKHWAAYQSEVDNGRLVEKVSEPYWNSYYAEYRLGPPTIRITIKGLEALHQKLSRGREPAQLGSTR